MTQVDYAKYSITQCKRLRADLKKKDPAHDLIRMLDKLILQKKEAYFKYFQFQVGFMWFGARRR